MGRLLTGPAELVAEGDGRVLGRLLIGALICFGVYGALAGFFEPQGGQVLIATFKAMLIPVLALLLCAPSFVVFHLLSEEPLPSRLLPRLLVAYAAFCGLVLVALGPVVWLFSVSSRYLGFVTLFHCFVWGVVLLLGIRFLTRAAGSARFLGQLIVWSVLVGVVTLQLVAYLGPVLVKHPEGQTFPLEKGSFFTRFGEAIDHHAEE
ncbi:MAG: hypothetical protein AAF604_24110 [Acidobacteriota bacterium]